MILWQEEKSVCIVKSSCKIHCESDLATQLALTVATFSQKKGGERLPKM
jgi:hypothetical protein